MSSTWHALADLILGACCPGCSRPQLGVCTPCKEQVRSTQPRLVQRGLDGFPTTVARARYAGPLRELILAAKERQSLATVRLLGDLLDAAVLAVAAASDYPSPIVLVPLPSARAVVRARGLDLTWSLARRVAVRLAPLGLDCRPMRLLVRPRGLKDQGELGELDRVRNLAAGLQLRKLPPMLPLLLVDDIVTTGATLAAAHRTLAAAGGTVLGAAVLGETVRERLRRSHRCGPG